MAASQIAMKTLELKNSLHLISSLNPTRQPELKSIGAPAAPFQAAPLAGTIDLAQVKEGLKLSAYQVVVVKFGGNAIGNEQVLDSLIDDTIALAQAGIKVIVVHGGGTAVNDALAAVGKQTKKIDGLRVTDSETLEIAVKVFTEINEHLSEKFRQKGASALGFVSKSTVPFATEKMVKKDMHHNEIDLGWVGEIVGVNADILQSWMWAGWIPIVAPLGMDSAGHFYNINADHAALALATELEVDGLIFMTDVPGLLQDAGDAGSRIGRVTSNQAQVLIAQGTVSGGMLPKIKSCLNAVEGGVNRIAILNSFEPHALLKGFLAPQEIGTLITGDKYDH